MSTLELASEPPQMLPKMCGGHLVTINSECLWLSLAPHTVQSDRNENQQVASQAVPWLRSPPPGDRSPAHV